MKKIVLVVLAALFVATIACAAPSLPITKPPVTDGINAGPAPIDPDAIQGQWFTDRTTGLQEVRTHEFYDNMELFGGGEVATGGFSTDAIYGKVSNIIFGPGSEITAFDIDATIHNDTGHELDDWDDGYNSHTESLSTSDNWVGTLYKTKLTAEFALNQDRLEPAIWNPPYTDQDPHFIAVNEDEEAWYCYNTQQGDFYVPTWDFGDIPVDESATRKLSFVVEGMGLLPTDPRYNAIMTSFSADPGKGDILQNRTTSLKISDWVEPLTLDDGSAYPAPGHSSDVSVFHNIPEPTSAVLIAGLGFILIRMRRYLKR